jgi:hypothetical protein
MTNTVISTSQTYNSTAYASSADGDTLTILPNVYAYGAIPSLISVKHAGRVTNYGSILSTGTTAIYVNAVGKPVSIDNYGTISYSGSQSTSAIYLYEAVGTVTNSGSIISNSVAITNYSRNTVTVINTGLIAGYNGSAIRALYTGSTILHNDGNINGAIDLTSSERASNLIDNQAHGTISGAVWLGSGVNTLMNSGGITGSISGGAGGDTVANSGTITGSVNLGDGGNALANHHLIDGSITTGSGNDTVINDGSITGAVRLGDGNDVLTNLHGTISGAVDLGAGDDTLINTYGVISGNIVGGAGDDTITGGDARDVIYGDNVSGDTSGGNDVLSGGYGDDLITGGYGNDTVYGNQGDDVLYGNQGSDWIHGGQGDDTIYGGQGNDTVNGGVGNDVLFGNLGDDLFVFAHGFGHDTIGDFGAVSGNSDVISFGAGTFAGYADVQSHMVQQGADVVITLGSDDTIVLQHVDMAALTADHFLFG